MSDTALLVRTVKIAESEKHIEQTWRALHLATFLFTFMCCRIRAASFESYISLAGMLTLNAAAFVYLFLHYLANLRAWKLELRRHSS